MPLIQKLRTHIVSEKGKKKNYYGFFFLGGSILISQSHWVIPSWGKKEVNWNCPGCHAEKNDGGECQGKSEELRRAVSHHAQSWRSLQRHRQPHNEAMVDSRGGRTWGIWKVPLSKAIHFHWQQMLGPLFKGGMMLDETWRRQTAVY